MPSSLKNRLEGFGWGRWTLDTSMGQAQRTRHKIKQSVQATPPLAPRAAEAGAASQGAARAPRAESPAVPMAPSLRKHIWRLLLSTATPSRVERFDTELSAETKQLPSFSMARLEASANLQKQRAAADAIVDAVSELFATSSPIDPIAPIEPQQAMLVETLTHVAGPNDPVRALKALSALRSLDPLAAFDASLPAASGHSDDAQADAWRMVAHLATVPSGLALLQKKLLHRPLPAQHERDFALLFKAAGALPGAADHAPTPQWLSAQAAPAQTIAQQAVVCAAARLAATASAETEQHAWALNAVRNDLYDTATGSPFATIDARLMKLGVWIDRASGDSTFMPRDPLFSKSPMRALKRYGLEQVERADDKTQRRAYAAALHEAVGALHEVFTEAIESLRESPADTDSARTELLVRRAVLEHCLDQDPERLIEGLDIGPDAIPDIAARLATAFLADTPPAVAHTLRPVVEQRLQTQPALQAMAKQPLNVSAALLEFWAESSPATSAAERLTTALQRARGEAEGRDTRPSRIDIESVRHALKDVIEHIQGSSRLRWTSGGVAGVGTKGITGLVSNILSAFTVRARVDARASGATQALFEIAMPPYNMEILLGTQRQTSWQVGGGIAAGADVGIAKLMAGADVVAQGIDHTGIQGISLRLPRERGREEHLRNEFSRLVDLLLDLSSPQGRAALHGEPLLQRLLGAFPDLTVNQIGTAHDKRRRRSLAVEAAASGDAQVARLGANVNAVTERALQQRRYEDATGSLRVHRTIKGRVLRATVGAGVSAGLGVNVADAGDFNGKASKASLSHPVLFANVQADLMLRGAMDRAEYVYQDGGISPASFIETEYQTIEAFRRSVEPDLDQWIEAKVARDLGALKPPADMAPPDQQAWRESRRDEVTAQVQDQFANFLHELRHKDSAAQNYGVRVQLSRQAAERINELHSAALLAHRSAQPGASERAESLQRQADALRDDPGSWTPASLRSYERTSDQDQRGIQLAVQIASIHSADSSRIRSRID